MSCLQRLHELRCYVTDHHSTKIWGLNLSTFALLLSHRHLLRFFLTVDHVQSTFFLSYRPHDIESVEHG